MHCQREQSGGRAEEKGEAIAHAAAKIIFRRADIFPRFPQSRTECHHAGKHDDSARCAPIGQQVQVIIVRAVGTHLDTFRTIFPETIVVMRRPDAPPKMIPPHLLRRRPDVEADRKVKFPGFPGCSHAAYVTERLRQIIGDENRSTPGQNDQKQKGRQPVVAMKNQCSQKHQQRHDNCHPAAARKRHGHPRQHDQSGVTEQNPDDRLHSPHQNASRRQRQKHFQKTREIVR